MLSLVGGGGGLVCDSVGEAYILSNHLDGKQSRESVDLPLTCHPSPRLITCTIWSSEVKRLLLDLDPYGGTDPLGMFPLLLKRTVYVQAPRLMPGIHKTNDRLCTSIRYCCRWHKHSNLLLMCFTSIVSGIARVLSSCYKYLKKCRTPNSKLQFLVIKVLIC